MSRVSGYTIKRDDLKVKPITPKELTDVDSGTFLKRLPDFDSEWKEKLDELKKAGKTIRYLGRMKKDSIRVGLQGTNNIIQIKTRRYSHQPLIIRGPGAGKEVTSAGVLADIRQIMRDGR